MPGVRLTPEQADAANGLLTRIEKELDKLSGGNPTLLFSLRRRIYIRLSYCERGNPTHRKNLKKLKREKAAGKMCDRGREFATDGRGIRST